MRASAACLSADVAYTCGRRYDFDALCTMVRRCWAEQYGAGAVLTDGEVYERLGIGNGANTLRRRGLSYVQADHLANRLGFHPCDVWPADWFVDVVAA